MEKLLPVERKINYKGYAFILLCIVISFVFILLCSVFIRNGSVQNQVKKVTRLNSVTMPSYQISF